MYILLLILSLSSSSPFNCTSWKLFTFDCSCPPTYFSRRAGCYRSNLFYPHLGFVPIQNYILESPATIPNKPILLTTNNSWRDSENMIQSLSFSFKHLRLPLHGNLFHSTFPHTHLLLCQCRFAVLHCEEGRERSSNLRRQISVNNMKSVVGSWTRDHWTLKSELDIGQEEWRSAVQLVVWGGRWRVEKI